MKICSNKKCPLSGEPQPEENFYRNITHADGMSTYCKACDKQKGKERQARDWQNRVGFMDILIGGNT